MQKVNWQKIKVSLWENFMALMNLFAGEDDFVRHGSKRWRERKQKSEAHSFTFFTYWLMANKFQSCPLDDQRLVSGRLGY